MTRGAEQGESGGARDAEPLPAQVPIGAAAGSSARPSRPSRRRRFVDTMIIVIAPILIPVIFIAGARVENGDNFLSQMTIGEVAFGIMAIAIAAITRAWITPSEAWEVVLIVSVLIGLGQCMFAAKFDNFDLVSRLADAASRCTDKCDTSEIANMAGAVLATEPSLIPWTIVVGFGVLLATLVTYTIWVES